MAYIQNLEDYENDITTGRMYFPSSSIRYEHKGRNFQVSKKGQMASRWLESICII